MVMNKNGISAIVATVLIILITIAAVVIIWAAVVPIIQEGVSGFGDVRVSLTIVEDGYTVWDAAARAAMVQVKRGVDDADVAAIRFYFKDDDGNSHNASRSVVPDLNEMKSYTFYFNNFDGDPTSVSIAAVFADGSLSEILSTVEPLPSGDLGGSVIDVSEGSPSTGGCNGCNSWPGDGSVTVVDVGCDIVQCASAGGSCSDGVCLVSLVGDVASCGMLNIENAEYTLLGDIDIGVSGHCFDIGADGVTLNLGGFNLIGDGSGNGVTISSQSGVTVTNGGIAGFGVGLWMDSADNSVFSGLSVDGNSGEGIRLYGKGNSFNSVSSCNNGGNDFNCVPTETDNSGTGNIFRSGNVVQCVADGTGYVWPATPADYAATCP